MDGNETARGESIFPPPPAIGEAAEAPADLEVQCNRFLSEHLTGMKERIAQSGGNS